MQMYEAYWGLTDKPFENTPNPRFLFRREELEDLTPVCSTHYRVDTGRRCSLAILVAARR